MSIEVAEAQAERKAASRPGAQTIPAEASRTAYLSVLVFATGAATLGMEFGASRLLEPVFGNNQIVWAALIGMILLYLAAGAWLGGKLADRYPRRRELDITVSLAALGVALVPSIGRLVLPWAATGMEGFAVGLLATALIAILLVFSVPGVLLGSAVPWAIRLTIDNSAEAGRISGRYSAIATAGSLAGAFLPVLWLIPAYGTRATFFILATGLLVVVSLGSLPHRHRWFPLLMLVIVLALGFLSQRGASIAARWESDDGVIIYEDESLYNYIVVRQWGSEHHLKLNDGVGLHSVYHPDMLMSAGIWDYFLLAPLLRPAPAIPTVENDRLLLIGLAAGTASELYTNIYGPLPITGVELDPQIIEVGQRYFGMNQENLTPIAADGRSWLARQPAEATWSIIAVDAYRPPYIPFHLTTVEFFEVVAKHLTDNGVLAINVGRTATNYSLVDALASTVAQVLPYVFLIDEPGPPDTLGNTLLVASASPISLEHLAQNVATLPADLPEEFRHFAQTAQAYARPANPPQVHSVFTDDHAPVERIVHRIIWDYLQSN
jgi:predicted membrane-bound spermidine synthase